MFYNSFGVPPLGGPARNRLKAGIKTQAALTACGGDFPSASGQGAYLGGGAQNSTLGSMDSDIPSTSTKTPAIASAPTQKFAHHVSVPSGEGVKVEKTITIKRPVSEVYAFWNQLENLPKFLRHVQSVRVRDDLHSHWAVKTVGEKILEWDSEIIERRQNEMISWRSIPGADVDNAGSVWFTPTRGSVGTVVRVSLKYAPAAGKAGLITAKLLGRDADSEIEEDLHRLKSLLETGHLPPEPATQKWQRRAVRAARKAAERADASFRQNIGKNPWAYVGSVAALGLIIGFALGWRASRPRPMQLECGCE